MNESIEHYFEQYPKINHAKIVIHFTFHVQVKKIISNPLKTGMKFIAIFFRSLFYKKQSIINCFYIKNQKKSLIC